MGLNGRRKIFILEENINKDNVVSILNSVLSLHFENLQEEDYLYWYRRGIQPILKRTKEVRPEICNKVVVNNANQVVVFKNGYFLTKPAFYKARKEENKVTKKVKKLNEYLYLSGKQQADNKVVNWFHTTGLGVVYLEPNKDYDAKECPVKVYALDPRNAFVVYSYNAGNKPLMAVNMVQVNGQVLYDVFTKDYVFKIKGSTLTKTALGQNASEALGDSISGGATEVVKTEKNIIGLIPIIEYTYNDNRMSAFECAISIMDEINNIESNRADGVELAVQQLCVAYNCNFDEGTTANSIRQAGMIVLKSTNDSAKADFKILESTLDQTSTQTTLDDLYTQMLEKCGVPSSNRDAGSTSDNVGAVYLRSGWASADTDCRNTEDLFKESNRLFDEVFLKILEDSVQFKLAPSDFELCFPRTDMTNLLAKVQAAQGMKELGFSPELALERSGLSNDAINDVEMSRKYIDIKWGQQAPQVQPVAGGQENTNNENVVAVEQTQEEGQEKANEEESA